MPLRLVLADDHPLILDALEHLFRLEPDCQVLARCRDGEETLQAVRQHQPDIVILDIRMPGKDGLVVLREMAQMQCPTRVVLLTAALDDQQALEALRLGACGVVLKEMAPRFLVQCVRKVHAGGQWLERRSVSRTLDTLLQRDAGTRELAGILTSRELDIVRLVSSGLRNREIADRLSLSEGTIKIHLHSIYKKLQIDGRLALTLYARDKGLV